MSPLGIRWMCCFISNFNENLITKRHVKLLTTHFHKYLSTLYHENTKCILGRDTLEASSYILETFEV